jgi:hypothetical protein
MPFFQVVPKYNISREITQKQGFTPVPALEK